MFPDLIDLGFLHLKTYGACMAVGFLLCWTLVEKLSGRKDLSNLLISLMVSGVLGSRIAYVIEHWQSEFAARPADIVRIDQGGLMFYGGLILAIVVFLAWCRLKKESVLGLADLLCTVIPLGHACGRLGCFFYGCCYGRLSDSPVAVCFPARSPAWYEQFHGGLVDASAKCSLPVLPTQLFEASALLVLFVFLLGLYLKRRRGTCAVYLVGYAVIRFGLEFLRGDPRAAFLGLSIGQLISLGMADLGIFFWIYGERTHHHR
jgi:phosphatidylglycerol---prolipoprotein diacylglyceryl transferase